MARRGGGGGGGGASRTRRTTSLVRANASCGWQRNLAESEVIQAQMAQTELAGGLPRHAGCGGGVAAGGAVQSARANSTPQKRGAGERNSPPTRCPFSEVSPRYTTRHS